MIRNKTIVQGLYNREMGNTNVSLRQCALLENVQRLRPIYELCHLSKSDDECCAKNYVSGIRFNCKGNLVGSSFCHSDKIDLWGWPENRLDLSIQVGTGCSVTRFDWLPYDAERLIIAVDKFGHLRLLDLVAEVSSFLLYVRSPGQAYDLHTRLPHCVTIADGGGVVSTLDLRTGCKISILKASRENDTAFDIQWLGINPQKYYEFCIAGNAEDLRIYDRRNTSKPIHKLYTTISSALNPNKDYDVLPDPSSSVVDLSTSSNRSCSIKLAYNYNGTKLVACCALDSVLLFDTSMSYPIARYDTSAENNDVKCFRCVEFFGPKSEFVVATALMQEDEANRRGSSSMYFWDTHTQKLVRAISIRDRSSAMAIHPHGPIIATSIDQRGIRLWA